MCQLVCRLACSGFSLRAWVLWVSSGMPQGGIFHRKQKLGAPGLHTAFGPREFASDLVGHLAALTLEPDIGFISFLGLDFDIRVLPAYALPHARLRSYPQYLSKCQKQKHTLPVVT